MRNIKEAMAVANEKTTVSQKSQNSKQLDISKKKFRCWILGIVISFLPLLAIPIDSWIGGAAVRTVLYELFCDISIMFVGISFTITALNDFIMKYTEKNKEGWVLLNIVLLILGAIIYTIVVKQKSENPEMDMHRVFIVNLVYFFIMLLLSASKYIKEIREVR